MLIFFLGVAAGLSLGAAMWALWSLGYDQGRRDEQEQGREQGNTTSHDIT